MTSPRESPITIVSPLIAGPLNTAEPRSCLQSVEPSRVDSATTAPALGSPNTSPVPKTMTPAPTAGAEYTGRPAPEGHWVLPSPAASANTPTGVPADIT